MENEITPTPAIADKVDAPTTVVDKAPDAPAEDKEEIVVPEFTMEQREELRKNLHASKEEALRLKRENDRLKNELKKPQSNFNIKEDDVAVFKEIAKRAGVPLQEDIQEMKANTYAETQQSQLDNFLKQHPEYGQAGDRNSDILWERLQEELADYTTPEDPKKWGKLLEKAHKIIADELSSQNAEVAMERGKSLGMAQAKLAEQGRLGSASQGGKVPNPKSGTVDPDRKAVEDMFKKLRPEAFK